jgi:peptidoglycan/xylan/chitin deacetylase (PgdA/CDA1 family)
MRENEGIGSDSFVLQRFEILVLLFSLQSKLFKYPFLVHQIAFRFDIDTHKCIRDGVPNILKLAEENQVKFSFFINMGKSVSRYQMLKNMIRKKSPNPLSLNNKPISLSAFRKLGIKDYIQIVLFNPPIKNYKSQIRSILENGHEIGLHGGRNHQIWAEKSTNWTKEELKNEVIWGLSELQKIFPDYKPVGFASPAWVHPEALNCVLLELEFEYCADSRGGEVEKFFLDPSLKFPLTTLVGEPGGIALIEHLIAKGATPNSTVEEIVSMFRNKKNPIAYDHPYFAGVEALPILSKIVLNLLEDGFQFQTISKLTND